MKKVFTSFLFGLLFVLAFALSACGDRNGTYYPNNSEMRSNLENNGYVVTIYQDLSDNDGNNHAGTLLYASKHSENEQEEYLYFYRFDNANSCDYYYKAMEKECKNYNSLVNIENDEKFGNIVYCGTEDAINSSGIKVVKVVVKV